MRTHTIYCVTTLPVPAPRRHTLRWAILLIMAVLGILYAIGANAQHHAAPAVLVDQATASVTTPAVADQGAGMTFNPDAQLDTTQVIDLRTPAAQVDDAAQITPAEQTTPASTDVAPTAPADTREAPAAGSPANVPCLSEDGATPGQVYPCYWDAAVDGNGTGESYWIDGPEFSDGPGLPSDDVAPTTPAGATIPTIGQCQP